MANELKALFEERAKLMARSDEVEGEYNLQRSDIDEQMRGVLERIAVCVEEERCSKSAPKKRTRPKSKEPDHDATAKRYAGFEPRSTGCLCGCGKDVDEGTNFVKGHQNRLRSIALAVAAGKLPADKMSTAGGDYANTQGWWIISEEND
jgi:hypothetical protein